MLALAVLAGATAVLAIVVFLVLADHHNHDRWQRDLVQVALQGANAERELHLLTYRGALAILEHVGGQVSSAPTLASGATPETAEAGEPLLNRQ